jgi:hypothetical protein
VHVLLVGGQRPHAYLTVGTGAPVQVAATVNVDPTNASPTMTGPYVNAGLVSAPAAAGVHIKMADARAARTAGRATRLRAKTPTRTPPLLTSS